ARIGAGNEVGGDLDLPERIAGRFEIQDAVGAVELFLDQAGDAGVQVLLRGPGIAGADCDGWGRNDRILRNRQERKREQPAEADEQRDYDREDRAVDEEA